MCTPLSCRRCATKIGEQYAPESGMQDPERAGEASCTCYLRNNRESEDAATGCNACPAGSVRAARAQGG
jgi:hypothetical protein